MKVDQDIDFIIDGFIGERMVYLPGIVKKKVLKDPRVRDLYITHIGIFPEAMGHLRKRPLGSSQYILIYSLKGEGWVEIRGKKSIIKANQLIIIPPKTPCSYGASISNPWTNYWVHFTGENSAAYAPSTGQVIDIPGSADARIDERLLLFEEMLQNSEDYFHPEKVVYANICLKQFLTSVKYLDVYRSINKNAENDLLEKLITYMKTKLHKRIKIQELAGICNCSVSNIYRLFKKNLDSAPQDFFIHLKIERARRYLTQTNMKVKDIGARLGYEDPYYFSRIFSKHTGLSPANFRKEER